MRGGGEGRGCCKMWIWLGVGLQLNVGEIDWWVWSSSVLCVAMVPITHQMENHSSIGKRHKDKGKAKPSKAMQASWAHHHTSNYFGSWLGLKIRERLCKGRSRFHSISKILGNVRKMFTRCQVSMNLWDHFFFGAGRGRGSCETTFSVKNWRLFFPCISTNSKDFFRKEGTNLISQILRFFFSNYQIFFTWVSRR
jgi:hypothetical protein